MLCKYKIQHMKKTICLNMIVKDESHVIEETLGNLCEKINFDYWVVCDTGSSDNTPQIIQNFFDKKKIKGELYFDTWKDFGHNRTLALQRAYDKTDYLLVFDADDSIEGDLVLPELTHDGYMLKIGRKHEYTYDRTLLVNNRKRWKFVGVLHEVINCLESNCVISMIQGDYCVISGRKGNRNKDPNKYYKDGIILEKAFLDAVVDDDHIAIRYCFYCANSFFDAQHFEKAIDWYKRYLKIGNWDQEKYVSCRNLYTCYEKLNKKEEGFYYLMDGFSYDRERMECLLPLIIHYTQKKQYDIVFNLYSIVKDFYENNYLNYDFSHKLFCDRSAGDVHVPYFIIIASLNLKKYETAIKMYEIIFTNKSINCTEETIQHLLHNFQICIERIQNNKKYFGELFEGYLTFLKSYKFPLEKYTEYITKYKNYFSNNICYSNSNNKLNLLFLTGFLDKQWNYTYAMNNALGGSETAVALLAKQLSQDYNVYIVGDVNEEIVDNMYYINNGNLKKLINTISFETTIISRFLIYLETINTIKTNNVYIWAHDFELISNGTNLTPNQLLIKYNHKINGCVCLTEWHKNLFKEIYPEIRDKIYVINNGIDTELFNGIDMNNKIKNQFVYTSRSERGLMRLLELWQEITNIIPDATLVISSYKDFPSDDNDKQIETIFKQYSNVKHVGKLNKKELYNLMAKSEYWFYPCTYPETSCITAMEMMMSGVICIYYPLAGLANTIGKYGVQVERGNEIETIQKILTFDKKTKDDFCVNGAKYASTCVWSERVLEWKKMLLNSNKKDYLSKQIDFSVKTSLSSSNIDKYLKKNVVRNKTINYINNDTHVGNSIQNGNYWEEWMFKYIQQNYVENTNMIDLGGNIGTTSLMMAEVLSNNCNIFTFEPVYSDILLKNTLDNNLTDRIVIYPYGVGNEIKILRIKPINLLDNANFGATCLKNLAYENDMNNIEINIVPLDYFNFQNVSLIKIDVEHMEIDVLEGCINLIRQCKPTILIETYQLDKLQQTDVYRELITLGYKLDVMPEGYNDYIMKIK